MPTPRTLALLGSALLFFAATAHAVPDHDGDEPQAAAPRDVLFRADAVQGAPADGVWYALRIGAVRSRSELSGVAVRRVLLREQDEREIDLSRPSAAQSSVQTGEQEAELFGATATEGSVLRVATAPCQARGTVTLAYHFARTVRRAEPARRSHVATSHTDTDQNQGPEQVTWVIAPRFDRIALTGAADLRLERWTLLAEAPDPEHAQATGKLLLYARLERAPAEGGGEHVGAGLAALAALGGQTSAPRGELSITPTIDRPLTTLRLHGALVPGVAAARLLDEAYLCDFDVEVAQCTFIPDPLFATHSSGVRAQVLDGRRLRLRWTVTPRFDWFETTLAAHTSPVGIELERSTTHEATIALEPGRRVVPLATLADGRSATITVEFEPAR